MNLPRKLSWCRVGDLYLDMKGEADDFLALDEAGQKVGVVKLMPLGPEAGAMVLGPLFLTHPGPAFNRPTNGLCQTRGEAARELRECWAAFRVLYQVDG